MYLRMPARRRVTANRAAAAHVAPPPRARTQACRSALGRRGAAGVARGRGQEENILSLCGRKLNSGVCVSLSASLKARRAADNLAVTFPNWVLCSQLFGS